MSKSDYTNTLYIYNIFDDHNGFGLCYLINLFLAEAQNERKEFEVYAFTYKQNVYNNELLDRLKFKRIDLNKLSKDARKIPNCFYYHY
jgi:hypothetical protein